MSGGIDFDQLEKPLGAEEISETSRSSLETPNPDEPTEEERHTLRKVSDKLPWSAFLVAVVELCQAFTGNGLSGPFQNYISQPYEGGTRGVRGAIGLGEKGATGLTNFFHFWFVKFYCHA